MPLHFRGKSLRILESARKALPDISAPKGSLGRCGRLGAPDRQPIRWTRTERRKGQAWGVKTIEGVRTRKALGAPPVSLFEPHQPEQCGWTPDVLIDIDAVRDRKPVEVDASARAQRRRNGEVATSARRIRADRSGEPRRFPVCPHGRCGFRSGRQEKSPGGDGRRAPAAARDRARGNELRLVVARVFSS
jgi:LmbE family N-acetylglucosaminyl deacetylase